MSATPRPAAPRASLVGAGPGAPDLLTLHAAHAAGLSGSTPVLIGEAAALAAARAAAPDLAAATLRAA